MEGIRSAVFIEKRFHYIPIDSPVDVLLSRICSFGQSFRHIFAGAQKNVSRAAWKYRVGNAASRECLECERSTTVLHFFLSCVSESTDRGYVGGNSPHTLKGLSV